MEDVIGGHGADERFAAFLADWQRILERRVGEATAAFSSVAGVRGLILAGGFGRGAPWPLSDIDILQDARDTLRVCALYATRQLHDPPYPAWLAISTTPAALEAKAQALHQIAHRAFTELP